MEEHLFQDIDNLSKEGDEKEMEFKEKMVEFEQKIHERKMKMLEQEGKMLKQEMKFLKKYYELESLRSDFARVNWKYLKQNTTRLTARNVLEFFEENCVIRGWNKREQYKNFAEEDRTLTKLTEWNFTASSFVDAALNFHKRMCKYSHTLVHGIHLDALEIPAEALLESEWKVLGVVWKLLPLPPEKLIKFNADGSETMIDELLKSLDK